jgi:hypothetical protein
MAIASCVVRRRAVSAWLEVDRRAGRHPRPACATVVGALDGRFVPVALAVAAASVAASRGASTRAYGRGRATGSARQARERTPVSHARRRHRLRKPEPIGARWGFGSAVRHPRRAASWRVFGSTATNSPPALFEEELVARGLPAASMAVGCESRSRLTTMECGRYEAATTPS